MNSEREIHRVTITLPQQVISVEVGKPYYANKNKMISRIEGAMFESYFTYHFYDEEGIIVGVIHNVPCIVDYKIETLKDREP